MAELLEKSRKINRLLQRTGGQPVDFEKMAPVLSEAIECNAYIASKKGKILGHAFMEDFECEIMDEIVSEDNRFPEEYNESILNVSGTKANVSQNEKECVFDPETKCMYSDKKTTIV